MKEKKKPQEKHPINLSKSKKQRIVWHRPQLKQLQLSLDTAFSAGSSGDALSASRP